MKPVIGRGLIGLAALLVAGAHTTAQNQSGGNRLEWNLRLGEGRGPIRTVDTRTPPGRKGSSEIVAGPSNGSDAAYLIYTRLPPGAHGPALFTLPSDHLYAVLSGKMTIQIGTDKLVAGPDTGVIVPAGVPHEAWNAEAEPEAHVEIISPASSTDLMSMLTPARPRAVDNARQYVRSVTLPVQSTGVSRQELFSRNTGSANQMRIDSLAAGTGTPGAHIHSFEQVYFVKEGMMTLFYGIGQDGQLGKYAVPPNSFVVIPPGVVHANVNDGPAVERHVVWLLPEPESGPLDFQVDIRLPATGGRGGRGPR